MANSLKKGMLHVFVANVISLVFSLLTNFILPKFLSVDSYSAIKTYQLYIVYIGILHFGYEDGMYIKYGGKNIKEIDGDDLGTNLFTLRIFQVFMTLSMIVVALIIQDDIFLAFSFAILPVNLVAYFKLLFQAIGEFSTYGRAMNFTSIVTFLINIVLVFLIKTDNYRFFIFLYVVCNIVLWIVLEIYLKNKIPKCNKVKKFSFLELKENIWVGLPLTLGNFSSVLLTSIDRWFVKFLLTTLAFAQYSFAVSTESFINVALTPIVVTLYNYFCKHTEIKEIKKIRNSIMIFASIIVSCAFGAKFIIEIFLNKYTDSIDVMFILFASQIFYVVIKGVYVNIYKSQKRQKDYFWKLIIVVIIGIVLNGIFFFIVPVKESFAFATLVSAAIWLVICVHDFPDINLKINEILFFIITVSTFIFCGIIFNSIIGFFVYIAIALISAYFLLKKETMYLFMMIYNYLNNIKKKIKG